MGAWNGARYDAVSVPQLAWGTDVVDRLALPAGGAGATVLDAGCGSGRVTETLLLRFPHAQVVAGDVSASMRDAARRRLAPYADRVRIVALDLEAAWTPELTAAAPFDAVLSTGTFHWVRDHAALYRRLSALLTPGGALVAQCGGEGSIAEVRAALDELGIEWAALNRYAAPAETAGWLRAAGFQAVWTWLTPEPADFPGTEALIEFLLGGALAPYLADLDDCAARAVAERVAARLGAPSVTFQRLNILARRP